MFFLCLHSRGWRWSRFKQKFSIINFELKKIYSFRSLSVDKYDIVHLKHTSIIILVGRTSSKTKVLLISPKIGVTTDTVYMLSEHIHWLACFTMVVRRVISFVIKCVNIMGYYKPGPVSFWQNHKAILYRVMFHFTPVEFWQIAPINYLPPHAFKWSSGVFGSSSVAV